MIEVIFNVSGETNEGDDMKLLVETDATPLDILISLLALTRQIWREFDADDPGTAKLFQDGLLSGFNNPNFWTREGESSHD